MKAPKRNLTTKRHFELFKKEAELWLRRFGLTDWSIEFRWQDEEEKGQSRAWCRYNSYQKLGTISLTRDWSGDQVTDQKVKVCAIHEVSHLLFDPLELIAELRTFDKDDLARETHRLIRRFENLFYGPESPTFKKV